jgi:hypothetical protein
MSDMLKRLKGTILSEFLHIQHVKTLKKVSFYRSLCMLCPTRQNAQKCKFLSEFMHV